MKEFFVTNADVNLALLQIRSMPVGEGLGIPAHPCVTDQLES